MWHNQLAIQQESNKTSLNFKKQKEIRDTSKLRIEFSNKCKSVDIIKQQKRNREPQGKELQGELCSSSSPLCPPY